MDYVCNEPLISCSVSYVASCNLLKNASADNILVFPFKNLYSLLSWLWSNIWILIFKKRWWDMSRASGSCLSRDDHGFLYAGLLICLNLSLNLISATCQVLILLHLFSNQCYYVSEILSYKLRELTDWEDVICMTVWRPQRGFNCFSSFIKLSAICSLFLAYFCQRCT